MTEAENYKQRLEINKWYASDQALQTLSNWYAVEKEEAFIEFVFDKLHFPDDGLIIEIGGGAAVHGRILARRYGERYLFTDLSPLFVEHAKNFGLRAMQMNGIATTLDDNAAACVLLVGPTTIIRDANTRRRQFIECARIIRPGGAAVFVTATYSKRSEFHRMDDNDVELLSNCGFSQSWRGTWGIIPGWLWNATNKGFFQAIEGLVANANVSVRSILIAYRNPGPARVHQEDPEDAAK